jgi:hypothetical protein
MGKTNADLEKVLDWVDSKMEKIYDRKDELGYDSLSKADKMIYLINSYDASVGNGGIQSFLDSPNGERFEDLISFLKEIKAAAVAKDLEELIDVLKTVNKSSPLSVREDYEKFKAMAIAKQFEAIESENTSRYYEYDPKPLQLLYNYLNTKK